MQKKKYPLFPAVKEPFFYGNIISGRSLGDVVYLASRKKYCFRLQLFLNPVMLGRYREPHLTSRRPVWKGILH